MHSHFIVTGKIVKKVYYNILDDAQHRSIIFKLSWF